MKNFKSFVCLIMPYAVITVAFLAMYASVQQLNRQSANDTPVQIAGDMTDLLDGGVVLGDVTHQIDQLRKLDMSKSLSPFVAIYDASGTPVSSQGVLDGQPIAIPAGVFASVASSRSGESRITLEPAAGVRIASDIREFDQSAYGQGHGFVVAGKNLRETENRIQRIGLIIVAFWAVSLVGWGIRDILARRG